MASALATPTCLNIYSPNAQCTPMFTLQLLTSNYFIHSQECHSSHVPFRITQFLFVNFKIKFFFSFEILENAANGSVVGHDLGVNLGSVSNLDMECILQSNLSYPPFGVAYVNQTCHMTVTGPLDHDKMDRYLLTVVVKVKNSTGSKFHSCLH